MLFNAINTEVAAVLAETAQESDITGAMIARSTNIPKSSVSRYLNGGARIPLPEFLVICSCMGADPTAIFHRALKRVRRSHSQHLNSMLHSS